MLILYYNFSLRQYLGASFFLLGEKDFHLDQIYDRISKKGGRSSCPTLRCLMTTDNRSSML